MHIIEFQNMMRQLYFKRDSDRGKEGTLNWLIDEVEELREAIKIGDIKAIEEEFADVLAWLVSLANIENVNLESVAITKYSNKCPKCRSAPCNCQF